MADNTPKTQKGLLYSLVFLKKVCMKTLKKTKRTFVFICLFLCFKTMPLKYISPAFVRQVIVLETNTNIFRIDCFMKSSRMQNVVHLPASCLTCFPITLSQRSNSLPYLGSITWISDLKYIILLSHMNT